MFIREPENGLKVWGLIVLSVVLMIVDHRYHKLDPVREYLSYAVYPMQWMISAPSRVLAKCNEYLIFHKNLVRENSNLREEQLLQNAKLQKMEALVSENLRLHSLLQSSPRVSEALKVAEIMLVDSDPFSHNIVLNKGRRDLVQIGQPIIDAHGIMGEIVSVNEISSRAILLTDASHAIPVENIRNGVRGVVVGTGSIDSLELHYVPTTADMKIGDKLVTSGLGGRYPPGYPVGTVTEIEQDRSESFANIRVFPAAQLERGRQVLLVSQQQAPKVATDETSKSGTQEVPKSTTDQAPKVATQETSKITSPGAE